MGLVDLQETGPGQTATEPAVDSLENGPGQLATETAHGERSLADQSQPVANLGPNTLRNSRSRRPPAHLDDYVCYNTRSQDPLSLIHRL